MTSWRGTPSFFEATGGRIPLLTDVTPIRHRKIALEHEVARLPIDPREFRGVLLDEAVPAAITIGQTVTVSGTVTDTDAGHNIACVRWLRGSSVNEPIDECGAIQHDWFSVPYTFADADAGNYALAVFLIMGENRDAELADGGVDGPEPPADGRRHAEEVEEVRGHPRALQGSPARARRSGPTRRAGATATPAQTSRHPAPAGNAGNRSSISRMWI